MTELREKSRSDTAVLYEIVDDDGNVTGIQVRRLVETRLPVTVEHVPALPAPSVARPRRLPGRRLVPAVVGAAAGTIVVLVDRLVF